MLRTLYNRVIIERLAAPTKSTGGLHLPDSQKGNLVIRGKVVTTGPGQVLQDGSLLPCDVDAGDIVHVHIRETGDVTYDGKTYLVVLDTSILAVEAA